MARGQNVIGNIDDEKRYIANEEKRGKGIILRLKKQKIIDKLNRKPVQYKFGSSKLMKSIALLVNFPIMDLPAYLTAVLLITISLFLFLLLNSKRRRLRVAAGFRLPPGPWKLPLIGSIHHLVLAPNNSLPHHVFRDLARKYGPVLHLQLGELPTVIVSAPEEAKQVLKIHDLAFASRPEILASKILAYNNLDIAFSPYGDYWKQMRKICLLELLSPKTVRSFGPIREDEARKLISSIQMESSRNNAAMINITEKVFSFTNGVVSRAAFGKRCEDQDKLISLINEAILVGGGFEIADIFPSLKFLHFLSGLKPKLLKLHRMIDEILDDIITEHKQNIANTESGEEGGDLLDVLLRIKERGDLQVPFSMDSIKAVIWDVFAAGTETSAATVDWAMSELIRHPGVMNKAQSELRKVLKGKHAIHETDLKELNYLKSVIKETLRLHPPLPLLLPRECREHSSVGGFDIPEKTRVIINAWAISRDPAVWEDAEKFKPERFVEKDVELVSTATGTNFDYIPFGGGRRICPGISFGMASVELALAQILYHFDWALPVPDQMPDMTETFGASARRKNSLLLLGSQHPHL